MTDTFAKYNQGYNVGVGGAVVDGDRILVVRRASTYGRGNWQIPGGFCDRDETLDQAVVREVHEEASLETEVQGVLGVRTRHDETNSTYVVFLLRRVSGEPSPGDEVDAARFVTLDELDALDPVPEINRAIAARALGQARNLLQRTVVSSRLPGEYRLFLG
ncbi:MAG: NUDIX domain-containing protein [Actinobacteria bacterium]|nr:NUDIX domain-containing protein [Actinomycetota bacterium]